MKEQPQLQLNAEATLEGKQVFVSLQQNVEAKVRIDTLEGREYMVVPMVMITVGVHNGSGGPLYYPEEELALLPGVWNHKPIVVYHPSRNGVGVSACDPDVLTNRKVGIILNTVFEDGKLKAEAWMERSRIEAVDERVLEAIENGKMVEVSTGLYTINEAVEGEFNGKPYVAIARQYRPDHLAILPDQKGACSIEDGAGLLRNESFEEIRAMVAKALAQEIPSASDWWIENVYEGFVVYKMDGKLFKRDYSMDGSMVTLSPSMVEVTQVTVYRTLSGDIVGNARECDMDKKAFVDNMISNGQWAEEDREWLMSLNEDRLKKMAPSEGESTSEQTSEEDAQPSEAPAESIPEEQPAAQTQNSAPKKISAAEYISNAPAEIRDMLKVGLQTHNKERQKRINVILNAQGNSFTKDQLESKPLSELQSICNLLNAAQPKPQRTDNYAALADAFGDSPVDNAESTEEPLELPSMDFSA